jgi:CheY-like chemotaxis protein
MARFADKANGREIHWLKEVPKLFPIEGNIIMKAQAPALKILVVEDSPLNIEAAKKQLAGYDLTVVASYDEAREYFAIDMFGRKYREETFDVVLTDVMLPFSSIKGERKVLRKEVFEKIAEQLAPYGPIIVLHALQCGVKRVGVLTAGNHHDDQFVYAFDGLSGLSAGDVRVKCSQGYDLWDAEDDAGNSVKNWKDLLDKLLT